MSDGVVSRTTSTKSFAPSYCSSLSPHPEQILVSYATISYLTKLRLTWGVEDSCPTQDPFTVIRVIASVFLKNIFLSVKFL